MERSSMTMTVIHQITAPSRSDARPTQLGGLLRRLAPFLPATTFLIFAVSSLYGQFRSTQWTTDSGLPQNIIRGIVQSPDGYLWIATLNGVARFDGMRFTTFDRSNSPGITANRFAAMVAGKNGDLWLYTEGGTIVRYHQSH